MNADEYLPNAETIAAIDLKPDPVCGGDEIFLGLVLKRYVLDLKDGCGGGVVPRRPDLRIKHA